MSLFEKGRAKTGGRRKGVKDRIGTMFLEELAKDFEEHGPEVIKIARIERPVEYLKIVAATLPKEFEITDHRLEDISDDELDALIDFARQRRAITVNANGGAGSAQDREPARLLPTIPEAKTVSWSARSRTLADGRQPARQDPCWWFRGSNARHRAVSRLVAR